MAEKQILKYTVLLMESNNAIEVLSLDLNKSNNAHINLQLYIFF